MDDFSGKSVLVTGSTRGIGRAIAESLLQCGATVGIHGRNAGRVAAECRSLPAGGGRVIALDADFDDPHSGSAVVRSFVEQCGAIDGLVNNAGGGNAVAFRGLAIDRWRQTFRLNLEAAVLATREAYSRMRQQQRQGCAIVNVASLAAHGPGKWMGADYAAAKAGLVSVTQSLAFEAARFGIRVNAVSPGFVETDLTASLTPQMRTGLGIPLGRIGQPCDVAQVVLFLLSMRAAYIAGQVLHVDGGLWMRG